MINKVILLGNLGGDPEIRHLESGVPVGKFTLATNESYKDQSGDWQQKTTWHNIVVWRSLAERAEKQLRKGALIYLEGKIQTRKWQDQEGKDHYITEVVANYFRNLTKREDAGGGYGASNFPSDQDAPAGTNTTDNPDPKPPTSQEAVEDDLPF